MFFKGGIYCFNLEDLLKALVEVLGKGSVGISYKLVMEEGTTMEVKRFKDIVETKKEFEMQMEVRGRLSMRMWFLSEPSTSRGTRNCLFIRRWKKWENETCIILNFVFFPLIFPYFVCANVGFCEIRLNEGNKFLAW